MSFKLTNDTKDTENYVECRVPMMMKLNTDNGINASEDSTRRLLYACCEMDKYADFYNFELRMLPLTKEGVVLFTMLDKGKKVEQYLWELKKQNRIPKEPNFTKIDEEVLNKKEEPKKEVKKSKKKSKKKKR